MRSGVCSARQGVDEKAATTGKKRRLLCTCFVSSNVLNPLTVWTSSNRKASRAACQDVAHKVLLPRVVDSLYTKRRRGISRKKGSDVSTSPCHTYIHAHAQVVAERCADFPTPKEQSIAPRSHVKSPPGENDRHRNTRTRAFSPDLISKARVIQGPRRFPDEVQPPAGIVERGGVDFSPARPDDGRKLAACFLAPEKKTNGKEKT